MDNQTIRRQWKNVDLSKQTLTRLTAHLLYSQWHSQGLGIRKVALIIALPLTA